MKFLTFIPFVVFLIWKKKGCQNRPFGSKKNPHFSSKGHLPVALHGKAGPSTPSRQEGSPPPIQRVDPTPAAHGFEPGGFTGRNAMKHREKTPVLPGRIVRNNGATKDQSDRSNEMNFNGLEQKIKAVGRKVGD